MASGNIAVATLNTGYITELSPAGEIVRTVKMPDRYPTNLCFGGPDMRTAYVTLSDGGQLGVLQWPEPGLKLNFNCSGRQNSGSASPVDEWRQSYERLLAIMAILEPGPSMPCCQCLPLGCRRSSRLVDHTRARSTGQHWNSGSKSIGH